MIHAHLLDALLTAILAISAVIAIAVVGAAIIGYPVKWMMNYLFTPTLLRSTFGVPRMTFWRAFWLFVLITFCFGSLVVRLGH